MNNKSKYLSSAFLLLSSTVIIKIIGALYKIPLTSYVGAVGRGYFSTAYNLYIPLHSIIMGAFPIALSRLVSKYNALNNSSMLLSLKKAAGRLFFIIGAAGCALLMLFAKPYAVYIAGAPKSVYTILVLAPSLMLSCIASHYRGYYEGFMDMKPTALSQMLEAAFKFVFGLLFARASMSNLYSAYLKSGLVLSHAALGEEEALSLIYPLTSAAAMLGVTLGTLISLIYITLYDRIKSERKRINYDVKKGKSELLSFSLPIIISCSVQSVFQFLDIASIQYSLNRYSAPALRTLLSSPLSLISVSDGDLPSYAYGLLCTALDFKNLIPGVTMALGVCAVPALCREYEAGNRERLGVLMNSVYKYTALLSVLGSAALALFSKEILNLFYLSSSPDIAAGADKLVKYFALTVPVYSLASTSVFTVQALGSPEKSISSYVISGIVRIVLNFLLIGNEGIFLYGAVISGAAGYFVLFICNFYISKKLSKVKMTPVKSLVKPVIIGFSAYFLTSFVYDYINITKNLFFNLLIGLSVFTIIYYILCIFLKAVDFKEIFCVFNFKKMA